MDPFWCISLGTLVVAKFWKRERRKSKERKYEREKRAERIESAKQKEVSERYGAIFGGSMTQEEIDADMALREARRQKERDIADLRKQGFTDELITTIIPTIDNGK